MPYGRCKLSFLFFLLYYVVKKCINALQAMNIGLKTMWKLMPKELAEMRKEGDRVYFRMVKETMQETLEFLRDQSVIDGIKREYTRARHDRLRHLGNLFLLYSCKNILVNNPEELRALAATTSLKESLHETFVYVQAFHKFHLILAEKFIFKDDDYPEYAEVEI